MTGAIETPPIPTAPETYDPAAFQQIIDAIERRLEALEQPVNATRMVVSNHTDSYALDEDTATLDELRNVVGTLIMVLASVNRIDGDVS